MILCAIALLSITPVLAYALKTPPEILPISRQYLTILFAGTPIVMTYNLMAGILRSLGDGKSPLIAMVIASILNVCLDLLFVMVFHWGVAGAPIATLIGQFCSCIFCFVRLRGVEIIRLTRADFAPERAVPPVCDSSEHAAGGAKCHHFHRRHDFAERGQRHGRIVHRGIYRHQQALWHIGSGRNLFWLRHNHLCRTEPGGRPH